MIPSRGLLAALVCLGLNNLSCGMLSRENPPLRMASPPPPTRAPAPAPAPPAERDPEVAAIAEFLSTRDTGLIPPEIEELARTLVREARRQDVDIELVMAVMHVESRYRNFAISPVGALGLMQILPTTGKELAEKQGVPWTGSHTLLEPNVNVQLGIAYLRELSDRYGHVPTALAAYNWGPGRIDRRLQNGIPMPEEYVRLVLDARSRQLPFRVATSSATKRSMPFMAASAEPR